jgi:hypothetical protein
VDNVTLSGSAIALITALLGAVAGALTFVFKALLEAKDSEIEAAHRGEERAWQVADSWQQIAFGLVRTGEQAATVAEMMAQQTARRRGG